MKKKLALICFGALVAVSVAGCSSEKTETENSTLTATQQITEIVTSAPTKAPTQAATEKLTEEETEEETEIVYNESGTFSVSYGENITEPPTVAETQVPTEEQTQAETEPEQNNTGITVDDILGSWRLVYYQQSNGQHTNPSRTITYTFNSDGTFKVNNNGTLMSGKYTIDNNIISYVADASGERGSFTYDEASDSLLDIDTDSGMTAVFAFI